MKILVVDDSKLIHKAVSQMISELGHEYIGVFDADEINAQLDNNQNFDIILLDWNMERLSGIEYLKNHKHKNVGQTKVLMMTTENDPSKIMEALEYGAVEYIMKPFTKEILSGKLSEVA